MLDYNYTMALKVRSEKLRKAGLAIAGIMGGVIDGIVALTVPFVLVETAFTLQDKPLLTAYNNNYNREYNKHAILLGVFF